LIKTSQNLFLEPIGQGTGDQVSGKGSRQFLAALLAPKVPKLFDIHGRDVSKPCVEIDGILAGCRFMADFAIGSSPGRSRPIADDPVERSELFVAGPVQQSIPLESPERRSRNTGR
jgi:hypothetical protein